MQMFIECAYLCTGCSIVSGSEGTALGCTDMHMMRVKPNPIVCWHLGLAVQHQSHLLEPL